MRPQFHGEPEEVRWAADNQELAAAISIHSSGPGRCFLPKSRREMKMKRTLLSAIQTLPTNQPVREDQRCDRVQGTCLLHSQPRLMPSPPHSALPGVTPGQMNRGSGTAHLNEAKFQTRRSREKSSVLFSNNSAVCQP